MIQSVKICLTVRKIPATFLGVILLQKTKYCDFCNKDVQPGGVRMGIPGLFTASGFYEFIYYCNDICMKSKNLLDKQRK
jgi:hypothetical protein